MKNIHESMPLIRKKCNRCKKNKPLDDFRLIEDNFTQHLHGAEISSERMKTMKKQYEIQFNVTHGRVNRCNDCIAEFRKECSMIGYRYWEKDWLNDHEKEWNTKIGENEMTAKKWRNDHTVSVEVRKKRRNKLLHYLT